MTDPHSPATGGTEADPSGAHDATLVPAAGALPAVGSFAPPRYPGEVGTLGRFRVLEVLGQGGMGAVFLGYDAALERKVALKVMLPQYAADADARERFLREARAAAKVRSEYAVTIFDVGEARVPFIAMEYLLGCPLDRYLKTQGELPLAQAVRVVRETALGLAAAHDLGLVHRDVKPGNIWLEAPGGRAKLLDFGLARVVTDDTHLTGTGAVIGTPAYMSPEQARGLRVDHRSDLFSLGVVLYRLCTGRLPFDGTSTVAILTALAVDAPWPAREHNPRIPAALAAVVARLLAKNPADRFPTAAAAAAALLAVERPPPGGPAPLAGPPLVIDAQAQKAWEGVEESGSVAVPQARDGDTEVVPAPTRRPPRTPSKVPAALVLVAVLVGCAALAAALLRPAKGTLVVESDDPDAELVLKRGGVVAHGRTRERTLALKPGAYTAELAEPTPGLRLVPDAFEVTEGGQVRIRVAAEKRPPRPAPSESDRRAAEYALAVGGWVSVDGEARKIAAPGDLPAALALTAVNLRNCAGVTDAGLAVFKDCKSLAVLSLAGTPVSDAGLAHFKGCQRLTTLDVQRTRVTDAGVDEFHNAVPGCTIIPNDG